MSPASNLPSLEKVDLDDCSNLKNVLIQNNSLEVVSLQRCASLEKVVLQCPRLKSISVQGCSNLEVLERGEEGKRRTYFKIKGAPFASPLFLFLSFPRRAWEIAITFRYASY